MSRYHSCPDLKLDGGERNPGEGAGVRYTAARAASQSGEVCRDLPEMRRDEAWVRPSELRTYGPRS